MTVTQIVIVENVKEKCTNLGGRTFHSGKNAYHGKAQVQEVWFIIWSCDISEGRGKEGMLEPGILLLLLSATFHFGIER